MASTVSLHNSHMCWQLAVEAVSHMCWHLAVGAVSHNTMLYLAKGVVIGSGTAPMLARSDKLSV